MSQLQNSGNSRATKIWTLGAWFALRIPVSYTVDCLLIFLLFPHFFQSKFNPGDPFPVLSLAIVFFGVSFLLLLSLSLVKALINCVDVISNLAKLAYGDNWMENLLRDLIEEVEESRSNKLQSKQKVKARSESIDDKEIGTTHLGYLKNIPVESFRYLLIVLLAKVAIPAAFVSFELFDVLMFSVCFAAAATLYKIVSDLLIVSIFNWRRKIDEISQ